MIFELQLDSLAPFEFSQYFSLDFTVCHVELADALPPDPEIPMLISADFLKDALLLHVQRIAVTFCEPLYEAETR